MPESDGKKKTRLPSEAQFRSMAQYVIDRAQELGLRDWRIEVERQGRTGERVLAHAEVTYGRRCITITLGELFWEESAEDQRDTVVHELLHAHLDGPAAVVRDMGQQLGDFISSVLEDNHKRQTELACDAIATAIARHFPLP